MSEQKWTPEDQWELLDWGHSCTLRIGEAYAGLPYEHPYGRGRCEKQMANGRRLIQCVKACKGVADPAAELARLRDAAEDVPILEAHVKGLLKGIANRDAELTKLRTVYAAAVEEIKASREADIMADIDSSEDARVHAMKLHDTARAEAGIKEGL